MIRMDNVGYKMLNVSAYRTVMGKDLLLGDIIIYKGEMYRIVFNNGTNAFQGVSFSYGTLEDFDYFDSEYHAREFTVVLHCTIGRKVNYV